ncbi:MAG: hypothetical protein AAFV53_28280 [Myxococcota bacterium]
MRRIPFSRGVTLFRYAPQTIGADGYPVDQAPVGVLIQANVQPAEGKDLEILPEGDRSKEVVRYSTLTEVRTVEQSAGTQADVLEVNGVRYEVKSADWWGGVRPHCEGLAVRVEVQP